MYGFKSNLSYSQMNLITHRYMCSFTNRMARMSLKKKFIWGRFQFILFKKNMLVSSIILNNKL
jgi:hypothetical protein